MTPDLDSWLKRCILPPNMTTRRKRPVGATLLAAAFLWIGCGGTLFFPIIVFFDGTTMWRLIAGGLIHSEVMLRITSYLFLSTWFLFYVAYAFIGFGLWKLRNWARKALLVLSELFAIISVLVSLFFVRPRELAVAVVIGTVIPFAWCVWYMKRPRVRFAFGAWPSSRDGVSAAEDPPGLSKKGKAGIAAAIVATFALYVGSLSVAIETMTRATGIYRMTVVQAQGSPCVASALGTPLTTDWGTQGRWEEGSRTGKAYMEIPVHGPKGKGSLVVRAEKQNGVWKINSLVLSHASERIQMTPPIAPSGCQ
jgi:hypothetical protein